MKIYIVMQLKTDNELLKIVKFFKRDIKLSLSMMLTLNTNFFRYIASKNVEILKNNKNMGKVFTKKRYQESYKKENFME